MKKFALICLMVMGCTVVMGATLKGGNPFGNMDQVEKIVKAVAAFYKGCESEKASVIMAELAIVDLAKKNEMNAVPRLEQALEELEEPGLRNFTKFLIANCHKENGDIEAAMDVLQSVIEDQEYAHNDEPEEENEEPEED